MFRNTLGLANIGIHPMDTQIVAVPALLLADDNPALLTTLVEMLQVKYRITAALPNGTSVLNQISVLRPDIAILDISLGDLTGFDVALRLRDSGCPAKIIFLTVHEDIEFVSAAFEIGASGYVFKSRVTEDLIKAIDIVFNGGRFASIAPPAAFHKLTDDK
jgi:DNA-binding NarL/FixJ family response regulator